MMITFFYSRQETNWWYWWKTLQYFFKLFKEHHILYLGISSQVYKYTLFKLLLVVLRMQFHMKQLVNSKQWCIRAKNLICFERKTVTKEGQRATQQRAIWYTTAKCPQEPWKKDCRKMEKKMSYNNYWKSWLCYLMPEHDSKKPLQFKQQALNPGLSHASFLALWMGVLWWNWDVSESLMDCHNAL